MANSISKPIAAPAKLVLLDQGMALLKAMCAANQVVAPPVHVYSSVDWHDTCTAWYNHDQIHICPARTAVIGRTGAAWSCPGYVVDKTAYGVLQHELGHHVDRHRSLAQWRVSGAADYQDGAFSMALRAAAQEAPVSGYGADEEPTASQEWFAEAFRLFATNPDLLRQLRPRTHATMLDAGLRPVVTDDWRTVLCDAPERTVLQARKKIDAARNACAA